jgi:hypothetical protein
MAAQGAALLPIKVGCLDRTVSLFKFLNKLLFIPSHPLQLSLQEFRLPIVRLHHPVMQRLEDFFVLQRQRNRISSTLLTS